MKIYITTEQDKNIEGFQMIAMKDGVCDVEGIIPNSCEYVIIEEALDYTKDPQFLDKIFSMVRKGGVLQIHGTDLRSLCLGYVAGEVDDKTFNDFIKDRNNLSSIYPILTSRVQGRQGINVIKADLNGVKYEIMCRRS